MSAASPPLLSVENLAVHFPVGRDWLGRVKSHAHAVNDVSLTVERGETLCIVGESGCGKSTLAQVLAGLVKPTHGRIEIAASGKATDKALQIVFQDPTSSLDPRLRVWRVITEPLFLRGGVSTRELRTLAATLAAQVGLRPEHIDRYPHEFSGGQRQRIAIARALSADPSIIVLDEPTSALDVSVQAQILNLLLDLQRDRGLTYVFISHDVSVVRHIADRVAVMYLGQIVESGDAGTVLGSPRHPYTRLLLDAVPVLGRPAPIDPPANAEIPSNRRLPTGCFFRDRCVHAAGGCDRPQTLTPIDSATHLVRCHRASDLFATSTAQPTRPTCLS